MHNISQFHMSYLAILILNIYFCTYHVTVLLLVFCILGNLYVASFLFLTFKTKINYCPLHVYLEASFVTNNDNNVVMKLFGK